MKESWEDIGKATAISSPNGVTGDEFGEAHELKSREPHTFAGEPDGVEAEDAGDYGAKHLAEFGGAIVGCPIEGTGADEIDETCSEPKAPRLLEVKGRRPTVRGGSGRGW